MVNSSYLSVIGAFGLAWIAVPIRVFYLMSVSGGPAKYDNTTPREAAAHLDSKGKLSPSGVDFVKRLTACQANGWENLPIFIGAVVIANQAGLKSEIIDYWCNVYLAARCAFVACYIAGGSLLGWARTGAYVAGVHSCLTLIYQAAHVA